MPIFTAYTGSDKTQLTDALLAPASGIVITPSSIVLKASGQDAVNLYDGTLAPLGIGAGLLLTSGTTPGLANTVGWFGTDNSGNGGFYNGDADIDAVVNTVFQTQSYDATTLSFDFTVSDPTAVSVTFDLVFGSDEFPEWVDQFVDSAIVMVNGVNYALFNHDPAHPLSVVSANLAAGYFQDNAGNALPIEYDGVSHVLKIVAPITPGGVNHIKIGIADTGDHIYDSGIFLANFTAGNIPGSGVVVTPPAICTDGNDDVSGSSKDEYFDLKKGDDVVYAGGGDDIVVAGEGSDSVFGGSGADQMKGDAGDDILDGGQDTDTAVYAGASTEYTVAVAGGGFTVTDNDAGNGSEGIDTLIGVERVKFSDGLFAFGAGGVLTPVIDPATPPSNTAGSVVISGIASVGKALTASVSDPDTVVGPVSYQWQVSEDGGANWSDVGTDSNSYTVASTDVGKDIRVTASYVDGDSHPESPISSAKTIQSVGDGDLLVTLIQLDAPVGASVINPLTTLVQDAIEFGLSPNSAVLTIKTVLGLPVSVNLQSYDAYAVLQGNPSDPTAMAVEKVAVEIAILTSLSDDDQGTNLTLKILEAAANDQTLDLGDANDLAGILGIDISGILDKKDYPQPLREIFDRHENIAQAQNVEEIEAEWQDFLSIQDGVNSTSIADLSIHVNQAPVGFANATLGDGLEDAPYLVTAADLLQGFSDPENDSLSVSGLSADNGTVTDNGDGTFTITPDANYSGPIELTYSVVDGQGASAAASQLFVIAPNLAANHAPTGAPTAVLASGSEDAPYDVSAAALLAGFSDADGDALSVANLVASNGTVVDNGDGTFTITPTADFNGAVTLNYDVTDGVAQVAATQSYGLAAVNDGPTANPDAASVGENEVKAFDVLANDTDPDLPSGKALVSIDAVTVSSGNALINGLDVAAALSIVGGLIRIDPGTRFDALNAGETATVAVNYTMQDAAGAMSSSVLTLTVNGAVEGPSYNIVNGTSGHDRNLNGTSAADQMNGFAGNDVIDAKGGDDVITAGAGQDLVNAGSGDDVVVATVGDGNDIYFADGGIDTFDLSQTTAAATVNLGTSLLGVMLDGIGRATSNQIGGDALLAFENVIGGSGSDRITGDNLANALRGGAGADVLSGGRGDDLLVGGTGNDLIATGRGDDLIIFATGDNSDVVTDFVAGADTPDVIDLGGVAAVEDFADLITNHASQHGADVVLDFGGGDTITLKNVALASLHHDDFVT